MNNNTPFEDQVQSEKIYNESADSQRAAPSSTDLGGEDLPVEQLQIERDQLYEKLARAQAEFQNSRKRMEGEFEQRMQYANSSLIKSLLPVIDNFERALLVEATSPETTTVLKGLQLVHDQWIAVLKQQSVEVISPKPGDTFEPNLHQAVMQQPTDEIEPGKVAQVFQNGYQLQGRVLRPASVTVAKAP